MRKVDLLILGAGLAGGLAAWRVRQSRPDLKVLAVERARGPKPQTWCFHDTDLASDQHAWLAPVVTARWPAQRVLFPKRRRTLDIGYNAITGADFSAALQRRLGEALVEGDIIEADARGALLASGDRIEAKVVLDARGAPQLPGLSLAYQKFLGLELALEAPHGLAIPILMDATVAQEDGYRFLYVLPFGPRTLLIEDTVYSENPELRSERSRAGVLDYAHRKGWRIARVLREERGVLPLVLGGAFAHAWPEALAPTPIGMRGLFFHPVTGYSLPDAVRVADRLATLGADGLRDWAAGLWRKRALYRALNRAMFQAARPDRRFQVFQRFYGLSEGLIGRFYAGRTDAGDAARILTGKPPTPVGRTLAAIAGLHG